MDFDFCKRPEGAQLGRLESWIKKERWERVEAVKKKPPIKTLRT